MWGLQVSATEGGLTAQNHWAGGATGEVTCSPPPAPQPFFFFFVFFFCVSFSFLFFFFFVFFFFAVTLRLETSDANVKLCPAHLG